MSTINQINNLSNAALSQLNSSSSACGTPQNADWFTDNATDSSQTITASSYFDSDATLEQMSHSILSCIGETAKP